MARKTKKQKSVVIDKEENTEKQQTNYHSNQIIVNIMKTKYPVIREKIKKMGWINVKWDENRTEYDLDWNDSAITLEDLQRMQIYQKTNHFPGMNQLSKKNLLAANLMKMQKQFPVEYDFFPQTYLLFTQLKEFQTLYQFKKKNEVYTFIIKPEHGCQGKGIFLIQEIEQLPKICDQLIAQEYINNPFLIDGLKFDLRLYVLVTGFDPLRVYLYKEGMARLATELYESPTKVMNLNNLKIKIFGILYLYNKVIQNKQEIIIIIKDFIFLLILIYLCLFLIIYDEIYFECHFILFIIKSVFQIQFLEFFQNIFKILI